MSWRECVDLIRSDLYRHTGSVGAKQFARNAIANQGFRMTMAYRVAAEMQDKNPAAFLGARLFARHLGTKYGVILLPATKIGPGFQMPHVGGVLINPRAVIGRDCTIMHGVTIGKTNRGERAGVPTIGDRVYIGPGAKVIGRIVIGDDAAIGANAVVTRDVPAGAVVAGVPARVIPGPGSEGYVRNTDYLNRRGAPERGETVDVGADVDAGAAGA